MLRIAACALFAAFILSAQDVREPSSYPARVALGNLTLGAEYMVHSLPTPHGSLFTEDYLVVDAAIFGPRGTELKLSASHFVLRINGKKTPILPQTPAWVAASIKNPGWGSQGTRQLEAGGGIGNAGVILGRPQQVERFPGDPTVYRGPRPIPAPSQPNRVEKEPPPPIEDQIQQASMPESERKLPASGLLFFAYKGKTKSIKSVELLYEGPAGTATLKLE